MYCGAAPDNDGASNHLTLMSVELPQLEVQYVDHRAGGAPVSIEIDVIQTRMECRFELIGLSRQVMQLLYGHMAGAENFFIYGNARDQLTGEAIQVEAQLRGQLGLVKPQAFDRGGTPHSVQYVIRGIVHYTLSLGDGSLPESGIGQRQNMPIYDWDFFTNVWAVGGVNQDGHGVRPSNLLFTVPV